MKITGKKISKQYVSINGIEDDVEFIPIENLKLKKDDMIEVADLKTFYDGEFQPLKMPPLLINDENFVLNGKKRLILAVNRGLSHVPVKRKNGRFHRVKF